MEKSGLVMVQQASCLNLCQIIVEVDLFYAIQCASTQCLAPVGLADIAEEVTNFNLDPPLPFV